VAALATDILVIFKRGVPNGAEFLLRYMHAVVGFTWVGLMFTFIFVRAPAVAAAAAAGSQLPDNETSRVLGWLHWTAASTLAFGVFILLAQTDGDGDVLLFDGSYWNTAPGISIATGMLIGTTMFANVWLVIGPNTRRVLANARNVRAGGSADPSATRAGRKVVLASRQNAVFAFPLVFFMVGTSHFFASGEFDLLPSAGDRAVYWAITLAVWAVLQLNGLGLVSGTSPRGLNWLYEDTRRVIGSGVSLVALWYVVWVAVF
jgi:uncharacterized membrane protein